MQVANAFKSGLTGCFLVRQDMSIVLGVRIEDMGHKMGCNGVDNGKLWFEGGPHCSSLLTTGTRHSHTLAALGQATP